MSPNQFEIIKCSLRGVPRGSVIINSSSQKESRNYNRRCFYIRKIDFPQRKCTREM